MKKFLSLLCAVLIVFSANAVPVKKVQLLEPVKAGQVVKAGKVDAPRSINASQIRKAPKSADDYVIITNQPEGELKTFKRDGGHYYTSGGSLYYENQSGTIDIVFGAENKVYFKDIISGLAYGTWVEGTLSADGSSVTVPLGQNLRYVSTYDACIAIQLLNYVSGSGFSVDETATEITFLYDAVNDAFTLQGTGLASVSLAGVWTDDGTIQNYGDYESVYTPYTPNTELVTLPDGLTPEEKPMEGLYYADVNEYEPGEGEKINATVKVAKDGDDVYIQGLVQIAPEAWVKGTLAGGEVEIPVTYLGEAGYVMGYSSSGIVGVTLIYDDDMDSYEVDGYVMVSEYELSNTMAPIYESIFIGERPALVTLPEGLTAVAYPISGTDNNGAALSGTVNVAIDEVNSEVYIQGLAPDVPQGWIIGVLGTDGTVVFPTGQYVGVHTTYASSVFLVGGEDDGSGNLVLADIVFAYDATKNVFIAQNAIVESAKKDAIYFYAYSENVVLGTLCDGLWIAAEQGYENSEDLGSATTVMGDGITGAFAQGEGSNPPKYYTSGSAARLYAGNTLTITADKLMGKIIITMTGSEAQKSLEANVGSYSLDEDEGTWTGEANEVIFSVPNENGRQARIQKIQIFFFDYTTTLVTLPEGIETSAYALEATDSYSGSAVSGEAIVGFNADSTVVYIQGLSSYLSEAWVKGTIAANGTVSIPNWFMGTYSSWFGDYDFVFSGATFQYDKEADKFVSVDGFQTLDEDGYAWDELENVVLTKTKDKAAVPADPSIDEFLWVNRNYPLVSFTINTNDVNGEPMIQSKISYMFWLDVENAEDIEPLVLTPDLYENLEANTTEIPYTFSDDYDFYQDMLYLNQSEEEALTWLRLGLQTIYRGGGEENKSNIVWYDVRKYFEENGYNFPEGIEETLAEGKVVKLVRDNQVIILKGDKAFNVVGNSVK